MTHPVIELLCWPLLIPDEKLHFGSFVCLTTALRAYFESLRLSNKCISSQTRLAVHTPFVQSRAKSWDSLRCLRSLSMPLWRRTHPGLFARVLCFYRVRTNTHHTLSGMRDQPLHVKPLSCPFCSLIKIRFCLCCHIWYGFPACTLGWGPSHSL